MVYSTKDSRGGIKQLETNEQIKSMQRWDYPRVIVMCTIVIMAVAAMSISAFMLSLDTRLLSNFNAQMNRSLFICTLTVIFMLELFTPIIAERLFHIRIAPAISIIFIALCFSGSILGVIVNFYHMFPPYDKILHFLMGVTFSLIGLALVQFFNKGDVTGKVPAYVAVIVFFAGVALGNAWEFLEFFIDLLLNANSQGYAEFETGVPLIGQTALMNTMIDLVLNAVGALVVFSFVWFTLKFNKDWLKYFTIEPKTQEVSK